jgi:hypothetical protein
MGPKDDLDTEARGKILCFYRGSNTECPVVKSVVRHYTNWATLALLWFPDRTIIQTWNKRGYLKLIHFTVGIQLKSVECEDICRSSNIAYFALAWTMHNTCTSTIIPHTTPCYNHLITLALPDLVLQRLYLADQHHIHFTQIWFLLVVSQWLSVYSLSEEESNISANIVCCLLHKAGKCST